MIADYTATGISIDHHPLGLLREQLDSVGAMPIAALAKVRHDTRVKVGGFVIARQKPGTAKGITFLLLEDEGGTLNVIVPVKLLRSPPPDRPHRAADPDRRHPRAPRSKAAARSTSSPRTSLD